MAKKTNTTEETINVNGKNLLKTVKKLIAEGNVRHISIKDKEEKVVMEFPLTLGVVGAVFLPVLAAVGAIAAMITDCTISVTRVKK
jgi:hypothetical protein